MSIVRFGDLILDQSINQSRVYKDSILVPLVSKMGPRVSTVDSVEDFYSKYLPIYYYQGQLVERLIGLGYRIVIYRVNYKEEYSTIKIMKDGYSFFDSTKTYEPSDGPVTSNSSIGNSSITMEFNIDKIDDDFINSIVSFINDEGEVITDPSLVTESDIKGNFTINITINNNRYVIKLQGNGEVDSYINSNSEIKRIKLYKYSDEQVTVLNPDGSMSTKTLGWVPNTTEVRSKLVSYLSQMTGFIINDNVLESTVPFSILTSMNGISYDSEIFKEGSAKHTDDIIYANSMNLDGLLLKSKNEFSGYGLHVSLTKINKMIEIRAYTEVDNNIYFDESVSGDLDPESDEYIIKMMENLNLIEYVSGDISFDYEGNYELGYTEYEDFDQLDSVFNTSDYDLPPIVFIADTDLHLDKQALWDELDFDPEWKRPYAPNDETYTMDEYIGNEYKSLITEFESVYNDYSSKLFQYLRRLSRLARSLNTIVLTSDSLIEDSYFNSLNNIIEVAPKIIDFTYEYTFELLLSNLTSNRCEGDVDFNGRCVSKLVERNNNSCILNYDRFKYTLTMPTVYFGNSESVKLNYITLRDYINYYALNKYISWYIDTNVLSKYNPPDNDTISASIMKKYYNILSSLTITSTKSGRSITFNMTMGFTTHTKRVLYLTSTLIRES